MLCVKFFKLIYAFFFFYFNNTNLLRSIFVKTEVITQTVTREKVVPSMYKYVQFHVLH